jgi:hypothetical protein
MAHRVTPQAEADLDDIWLFTAKESCGIHVATRLIDAITGRFRRPDGVPVGCGCAGIPDPGGGLFAGVPAKMKGASSLCCGDHMVSFV